MHFGTYFLLLAVFTAILNLAVWADEASKFKDHKTYSEVGEKSISDWKSNNTQKSPQNQTQDKSQMDTPKMKQKFAEMKNSIMGKFPDDVEDFHDQQKEVQEVIKESADDYGNYLKNQATNFQDIVADFSDPFFSQQHYSAVYGEFVEEYVEFLTDMKETTTENYQEYTEFFNDALQDYEEFYNSQEPFGDWKWNNSYDVIKDGSHDYYYNFDFSKEINDTESSNSAYKATLTDIKNVLSSIASGKESFKNQIQDFVDSIVQNTENLMEEMDEIYDAYQDYQEQKQEEIPQPTTIAKIPLVYNGEGAHENSSMTAATVLIIFSILMSFSIISFIGYTLYQKDNKYFHNRLSDASRWLTLITIKTPYLNKLSKKFKNPFISSSRTVPV